MKTVGVIGNGFVGNAIYQNFKHSCPIKVFDIDPQKAVNSYEDTISSDIIFVCLPTPMMEDGNCNISYVQKFFTEIPQQTKGLFVLKSTVPIGTTDSIRASRTDLRIVHNPEFLTADNAEGDFFNCDRNVIGGDVVDAEELASFLYKTFPEWENIEVPCYIVKSVESETIKYFANSFLAVKIAYFNNVYQTCSKFGMDYVKVKNAITEDKRIGRYHTKVPGPDGKLGFGGYCFPKDINALIHSLNDFGIDSQLLSAAWHYNKTLRDDVSHS
jgi:UDPglucose 6-dehydrogenase